MEHGNRNNEYQWVRLVTAAGLAASMAVPAACSSSRESVPGPPASISVPASTPESVASTTPTTISTSTATQSPETSRTLPLSDCTSAGAEQPGYYFNERYAPKIADQLQLLNTAYTPGSNVDISKDGVTYIELVHTMENDPEYAQAMLRASDTVKANPSTVIAVSEFLSWPVTPPAMCAPQRISDPDRKRELQQTKTVAQDVGSALIGHLSGQASRLAQGLAHTLSQELQQFLSAINSELQQLGSG